MPRLVDHEQRRAALGEAAIRLILRDGLAGVTIRGVAAEAGFSTGSLRHYFADQHELRAYAVRACTETLRLRVMPRVRRPRTGGSVADRIVSIIEELLPLDDRRREEYALWSAITEWERAYPPADGSVTWRHQRALYRQCVAALRGMDTSGDLDLAAVPHPDADVERWAAILHTFADGLAAQLTTTPNELDPHTAARLLRSLLRAVPGYRGP